jgi:hypothetical protein
MGTPILPTRNERGVALVMALVVLLTLSLLSVVLMLSVSSNRKLAGNGVRLDQALNTAEAGVGEVCSRIKVGDIALPTGNPRAVAQIFLTNAGSVPVPASLDTTAMQTRQPAGEWLTYSTATKGPDVLTCEFLTDPARTMIYRYDGSRNPPVNTVSGFPIYKVTSTGRAGNDRRRIVTQLIQRPFNANVNGALQANVGIDFKGNTDVCGYNHPLSTPNGTKGFGQCSPYHTIGNDLPGAWSTTNTTQTGSAQINGSPIGRSDNNVGFFSGPWDALGMTQAEFMSWIGPPSSAAPQPPVGIVYLDNDGVSQNQSGSYHYNGGDGEGLLYVDGDLQVNGNFNYKGLIYVEGNLSINGTCWVLGGIVVRGKTRIDIANGNCTVLYSSEAIEQNISKHGGQFVTLAWREVSL